MRREIFRDERHEERVALCDLISFIGISYIGLFWWRQRNRRRDADRTALDTSYMAPLLDSAVIWAPSGVNWKPSKVVFDVELTRL